MSLSIVPSDGSRSVTTVPANIRAHKIAQLKKAFQGRETSGNQLQNNFYELSLKGSVFTFEELFENNLSAYLQQLRDMDKDGLKSKFQQILGSDVDAFSEFITTVDISEFLKSVFRNAVIGESFREIQPSISLDAIQTVKALNDACANFCYFFTDVLEGSSVPTVVISFLFDKEFEKFKEIITNAVKSLNEDHFVIFLNACRSSLSQDVNLFLQDVELRSQQIEHQIVEVHKSRLETQNVIADRKLRNQRSEIEELGNFIISKVEENDTLNLELGSAQRRIKALDANVRLLRGERDALEEQYKNSVDRRMASLNAAAAEAAAVEVAAAEAAAVEAAEKAAAEAAAEAVAAQAVAKAESAKRIQSVFRGYVGRKQFDTIKAAAKAKAEAEAKDAAAAAASTPLTNEVGRSLSYADGSSICQDAITIVSSGTEEELRAFLYKLDEDFFNTLENSLDDYNEKNSSYLKAEQYVLGNLSESLKAYLTISRDSDEKKYLIKYPTEGTDDVLKFIFTLHDFLKGQLPKITVG